tara:strand:- start:99 stop:278 length:180 start_codon:yes stop_codon:yes gene_type:complete
MEIPEHILTTIVLKLEKIKKEIADDDKQKAILSIDLLLENVNSIEILKTNGPKIKKTSK